MWWVGSEVLEVYLGTRVVALGAGGRTQSWDDAASFDEALGLLKARLASVRRRAGMRVWLSGALCRVFLVPEVQGLHTLRERQTAAEAMAACTGLPMPCDVWLDETHTGGAGIAVAVERDRLLAIREALQPRRVLSMRPWWCEALRLALQRQPSPCALCAHDCDSVTMFSGVDGSFDSAVTLAPIADTGGVRAALKRTLVMAGGEPSRALHARLTATGATPWMEWVR